MSGSFAQGKIKSVSPVSYDLAQGNVLAPLVEISLNQFYQKSGELAQRNVLASTVEISLNQFCKGMKVESTSFLSRGLLQDGVSKLMCSHVVLKPLVGLVVSC